MFDENTKLELKLFELDLIRESIEERIQAWERVLRENEAGEQSLLETIDCISEIDAEFLLESYRSIAGKLRLAQGRHDRNDVKHIDETQLFRPEQTVELLQVRYVGVDRIFYVFQARHGHYLIYDSLEALINAFLNDRESKVRFETYKEVELYLAYWKPRL